MINYAALDAQWSPIGPSDRQSFLIQDICKVSERPHWRLPMAYDVATLANLSDRELTNLSANVDRLALTGSRVQMDEAERLKPLIEQELVARQAAKRPTSSVKATSKSAPKPRAKAKPKAKV